MKANDAGAVNAPIEPNADIKLFPKNDAKDLNSADPSNPKNDSNPNQNAQKSSSVAPNPVVKNENGVITIGHYIMGK